MNTQEIFSTSYRALLSNKIRAALTMLGVIIGVMSVILLIAIGRGVQNYVTDQFEALGANLIFVYPGQVALDQNFAETILRNDLQEKHLELIRRHADGFVSDVTPMVRTTANLRYKTKSYVSSVAAFDENGFSLLNFSIDIGRPFTGVEVRGRSRVVVLGPNVAKELFPAGNHINSKLTIGNHSYEVIGIFKPIGPDFDNAILLPYTSAMDTFNIQNLTAIVMRATNENDINIAVSQVNRALIRDLSEDEFTVLTQEELLTSIQEILQVLTVGLGAIAGISLIVGGIGIMNIMLVSVTERTREIGLRKALGAKTSEITFQFLTESTMLSLGGGLIGLALGWLGSLAARGFIRTEVPFWAVVLAFSFAAFVGIIFGTYPAIKAGKKDPIEALRYE